MSAAFDRAVEDIGNIVMLEHVNFLIPDQQLATAFYVSGLGFTRDPYLMTGLDNMWINIGRCQMHLPTRSAGAQRMGGVIGLKVPDLDAVADSLNRALSYLKKTEFGVTRTGGVIETTCPWGNRFRLHAAGPEFGNSELGIAYIELDARSGVADGIAAFYSEIMGAPATVTERAGRPTATVAAGPHQHLHFMETDGDLIAYDGYHFQIYIADFSGPYRKMLDRGLVTRETDQHEWRFIDIVDPRDDMGGNEPLFQIEHEVRSMKHPLYGRHLVNRNAAQTQRAYRMGQDEFRGSY